MAFPASQLLLRRPPRRSARRLRQASAYPRALLALLCGLASCADLTRPPAHRLPSHSAVAALQPIPGADGPALAPAPPPAAAPEPAREKPLPAPAAALVPTRGAAGEQVGASHILVAYRGATRAKPTVTRSKEDARQLAQSLAERARQGGMDFAQLAREASDGPTGIEGGALPKFGRQQMVKPFSDAAFALQPGQISDVVETNFGFHIIKRTE